MNICANGQHIIPATPGSAGLHFDMRGRPSGPLTCECGALTLGEYKIPGSTKKISAAGAVTAVPGAAHGPRV